MKQAKRFPVVEVRGSHFEMGRQYGSQCGALIRDLASRFDDIFVSDRALQEGARRAMDEAVPAVRAAAPELLEEVEGIAAGAGLSFGEAFRLNCAAEMGQWFGCAQKRSAASVSDQCTSVAADTGDGALVAWNMDWYPELQPYMVLLHGQPEGEPAFLAFALAGSVGRPGLSEQIAIGANQLPYRPTEAPPAGGPEWAGPGVPYSFVSRMLLQQRSVRDALALLRRTRRMVCLNYTLGDATGDICCVETTPAAQAVLRPSEGFLTHANTFHTPEFHGMPEAQRQKGDPRAYAARALLRERQGRIDPLAIAAAQSHHFPGRQDGVCVHHPSGDRALLTLLSFIGEVGKGRMWAAYGPPCRHEFLPYDL
ncbi:MAG: hypothetical protein HY321_21330 [Armatimonadetes bacterium]|nr:hypothetical protein [Armatimonadota bacterium]